MSQSIPRSTGKAPVKSVAPSVDAEIKKPIKRKNSSPAVGLQHRPGIKKCAKEMSPDGSYRLSGKAESVLCGLTELIIEHGAIVANSLVKKINKVTVTIDDVIYAYEILLKGELKSLCVKEIRTVSAKLKANSIRK